jgi:hypothetical protein
MVDDDYCPHSRRYNDQQQGRQRLTEKLRQLPGWNGGHDQCGNQAADGVTLYIFQ